MREVGLEPAALAEGPDQIGRLGSLDIPGGAALGAVQVAVLRRRQDMELLPSVSAVTVLDDAELLKDIQCPVDGGRDGLRVDRTAPLEEFSAGDVTVRLRKDVHQDTPLWRPAHPSLVQPGTHRGPRVFVERRL